MFDQEREHYQDLATQAEINAERFSGEEIKDDYDESQGSESERLITRVGKSSYYFINNEIQDYHDDDGGYPLGPYCIRSIQEFTRSTGWTLNQLLKFLWPKVFTD